MTVMPRIENNAKTGDEAVNREVVAGRAVEVFLFPHMWDWLANKSCAAASRDGREPDL